MKFTINKSFLFMSDDFEKKYNFSVVTHFIDVDFYIKGFNSILCLTTDLETMFIIDFVDFY